MTLGCFPGGCFFKITLIPSFIEAVISSTSLVRIFFIVFTYDFEQAKRVRNEQGADKLNFLPQVIHSNIWYDLNTNSSEYQGCGLL